MKLDTEFIKLPLTFDVERMRAEVEAIPESDWRPHPQGHSGNSALPLIALNGNPMDDGVAGTMLPTPHLEKCEYLRQVLASFETVFGRSRLMRLEGESEATLHVDTNYYWADRVRIHVPILTSPVIEFICNERSVHMPAGEAWIFDAWRLHNVLNPTGDQRIHLVADTVGSATFWDLVARGERPFGDNGAAPVPPRHVAHEPGRDVQLPTERANYPLVMSPWEQELLADAITEDLAADHEPGDERAFSAAIDSLRRDWRVVWALHGQSREGWSTYDELLKRTETAIAPLEGRLKLTNDTDAVEIARQMLIRPALNPQLADGPNGSAARPPGAAAGQSPRVGAERGVSPLADPAPLRPPDLHRRATALGDQPPVRGAGTLAESVDRRRREPSGDRVAAGSAAGQPRLGQQQAHAHRRAPRPPSGCGRPSSRSFATAMGTRRRTRRPGSGCSRRPRRTRSGCRSCRRCSRERCSPTSTATRARG